MIFTPMIVSAVLPAAVDGIKNVVGAITNRFIGYSVDDQVKLTDNELKRLEAVAKLDTVVGTPSQWVVDLRASFRYIAAGVLILIGSSIAAYGLFIPEDVLSATVVAFGMDTAGAPFGFIFGERMWQGLKGLKK